MSPKNPLLSVGATILGLLAGTASRASDPAPTAAPGRPRAATTPTAPLPRQAVLLLYDGGVQQGPLIEEPAAYLLRHKVGSIRFPKDRVEKVFRSLDEVYDYKRSRFPDRDPDEHLKLARWCLSQHLYAGAKEQLQAVLRVSKNDKQAQVMLANLEAAEERRALRDPDVSRANFEVEEPGAERPEELSSAVIRRAQKELGVSGLPVIFDLPTSVAVRRAEQFQRNVHPILQKYCAQCHNEKYQGRFQLVQVKSKRDWATADVFRANLDATLRLIAPQNPAQSELLASALVPHGWGENKRPIFRGSNDPAFQILAAWVNSLQSRPTRDAVAAPAANGDEPFAAGRAGRGFATGGPAPPSRTAPPLRPVGPDQRGSFLPEGPPPLPPGQLIPGSELGSQPYAPPGTKFVVPYTLGGPQPELARPGAAASPSIPPPHAPGTAPATAPTGPLPALPVNPAAPGNDPRQAAATSAAPAPQRKPLVLDPALLERALKNRNGSP